MSETILNLKGQEIAVKTYHSDIADLPVLALHGWLDNAATFTAVAPLLKNIQLIALDLPGHGLSAHRAQGAEYYIWSYVEDVIAVADALNLQQFSLLGHSMGGAVACLVSSLYPERVAKMALLDSMGPMTTSAAQAPAQMSKALRQKQHFKTRSLRYYTTREAAIEARARKGVSLESATTLGSRGIACNDKGYYWVNDQRLSRLNLMSMTEEQVSAFFKEIVCPSCLISSSWSPKKKGDAQNIRLSSLFPQSHFETFQLDGNHHQHLEGKVEEVADLLNRFFIE